MGKTSKGCVFRVSVEPGVALAVEICGPRHGPVVIFSNSLASDRGMWDEVVERLAPVARIIRYDTRGHGESNISIGPTKLQHLGQDVLKIMNHLEIECATFCGLSLGGLIGMWLGANAPKRFSGLVLANTASRFPPPQLWKERAAAVRSGGMSPLVGPTLDRWLTKRFQDVHSRRTTEIERMISSTSVDGYSACCEILAGADESESLQNIRCPVRVLVGQHDRSTPPSRGAELVAALAKADFVSLDAAHLSAVEAPGAFATSIREFIDSLERA